MDMIALRRRKIRRRESKEKTLEFFQESYIKPAETWDDVRDWLKLNNIDVGPENFQREELENSLYSIFMVLSL